MVRILEPIFKSNINHKVSCDMIMYIHDINKKPFTDNGETKSDVVYSF